MSGDTEKTEDQKRAERQLEQEQKRAERERERAEHAEERLRQRAERARENAERAEERIRARSEQAQEKIARALDGVADAEDRAGEMVARALERAQNATDREGAAVPDFEPLVWFRQEPTSRRPAHTRADIARAAMEIADSEGFDAVSMRRVAQRLGAGTMTLYHYVRNKEELIALMGDAVMAEILVPEGQLSDDWRAAVTQVATRTRAAFAAHHWIFQHMDDGTLGPNGMRHFEQTLAAIAPLGLAKYETFEVIGQIDDYVFGYALREVQEREEQERGLSPSVVDFFNRELATGEYPLIEGFFGGEDIYVTYESVVKFMAEPGRFDRGLDRLLNGIEAEFAPK